MNQKIEMEKENITQSIASQASDALNCDIEEVWAGDENFFVRKNHKSSRQKRMEMSFFDVKFCQYGVSSRAGAALWNSALEDLRAGGFFYETSDTSDKLVADHHKLKREMEKIAMSQRLEQEQVIEAKKRPSLYRSRWKKR